jgi:hypothetical protein
MSVKLKVLKDLQYSKWLLLCIYMQLGILRVCMGVASTSTKNKVGDKITAYYHN